MHPSTHTAGTRLPRLTPRADRPGSQRSDAKVSLQNTEPIESQRRIPASSWASNGDVVIRNRAAFMKRERILNPIPTLNMRPRESLLSRLSTGLLVSVFSCERHGRTKERASARKNMTHGIPAAAQWWPSSERTVPTRTLGNDTTCIWLVSGGCLSAQSRVIFSQARRKTRRLCQRTTELVDCQKQRDEPI